MALESGGESSSRVQRLEFGSGSGVYFVWILQIKYSSIQWNSKQMQSGTGQK